MNKTGNPLGQAITKHPVTCLGLFCLLLTGVFSQSDEITFATTAPLILAAVTLVAVVGQFPNKKAMLLTGAAGVAVGILGFLCTLSSYYLPLTLALSGGMILLGITVTLLVTRCLTQKRAVLLLFALGFLLRLCYVLYTSAVVRQHDVWYFSNGDFIFFENQRHAEYIEYIATYLRLPALDPTTVGLSQLYHPPFHHLLAGLWLRLNTLLGIPYSAAVENIQLLTLFYSSAVMVIAYRILRFLGCRKASLFLPLTLVVLHPTFILMAGSVNNDLLSVTLALYAVYATLRWTKTPTLKTIIPIALGVGLSMMSKLSGGMVAPAIALVFLWKWWEAIRKKDGTGKEMFWQFALFGVICVPLGLWWQVKNLVAFGLPLTYVPALTQNSGQYIGDYTPFQRLFEIQSSSLGEVFLVWKNQNMKADYNEYNMLLAFLKTSVFGEFTLFDTTLTADGIHTAGTFFAKLLFFANAWLSVCSLGSGIYLFTKKKHRKSPVFWMLFLVLSVFLLSYIRFCFAYPQTCTQNFRYAVPTLMAGCGFLGLVLKDTKNTIFHTAVTALTLFFGLGSAVCYTLLGLV